MLETTAVRSWSCRSFYGRAVSFYEVALFSRAQARLNRLFTLIHSAIERCASGYFDVMEAIFLQNTKQGGVPQQVPVVGTAKVSGSVVSVVVNTTVGAVVLNNSPVKAVNDDESKIKTGGRAMKKTMLALALLLGVAGLVSFVGVMDVSAAATGYTNDDVGYVIVRCTISISVDVLDTNATWYIAGMSTGPITGVTPGATYYSMSTSSVSIRNSSSGAMTKWTVHVSTIQTKTWTSYGNGEATLATGWVADDVDVNLTGWRMGSVADINTCALSACFKVDGAVTALDFPINGPDTTSLNLLTMRTASDDLDTYSITGRFLPISGGSYPTAFGSTANWVLPGQVRSLGFKFSAPTVVSDQNWRRFVLLVSAGQ